MRTQAVLSLLCNDCDSWPGIDDGHLPPLGLAYQYQWLPLPIERASASSSPLVRQEQVAGCPQWSVGLHRVGQVSGIGV